jgi:hypothetical protein
MNEISTNILMCSKVCFLFLHAQNLVKKMTVKTMIFAKNLHKYELLMKCRESHNTTKQQINGNLADSELPTGCSASVI